MVHQEADLFNVIRNRVSSLLIGEIRMVLLGSLIKDMEFSTTEILNMGFNQLLVAWQRKGTTYQSRD
jgi:hypothetical protein